MDPRNYVDERWFLRSRFWLCVAASVALIVAHQSGYGLRPTERVEEVEPEHAPREK